MTQRKRRRNSPDEVLRFIEHRALRGVSGTEIHKALVADPELGALAPELRTVQEIAREHRPRSPGEAWRLSDAAPGEIRPVLETLSAMVQETEGRVSTISIGHAEHVVRLAEASPSLPPWLRWVLAVAYDRLAEHGESTELLDLLVAFEPWRDDQAWLAYRNAVRAGTVRKPTVADTILGTGFERHLIGEAGGQRDIQVD